MNAATKGARIHINGIVQGVGFRPFVYSLALQNNLKGWVRNSSSGVEIEITGQAEDIATFSQKIQSQPPPLARIDSFSIEESTANHYTTFSILTSQLKIGEFVPISPDVAICPDCQRELFDPSDRRFRYPFINCTNCGPRFTIIQEIPYDRPLTTMAGFDMCPDCETEYKNPLDRRFHAQPIACPKCGPQVLFHESSLVDQVGNDAILEARRFLKNGKILAVKGLGGFHLACDAANLEAVEQLRERKHRSDKPFALMAYNLHAIRKHCLISPQEESLLKSRQQPIVILRQREDMSLSPLIAPNQRHWGIMLAYTPLHLLLLEPGQDFPEILVMTSGNLSEEPIAYQDDQALERLEELADGFLLHNRPIHMRTDDSVARIVADRIYLTRRSRGYAPDPIQLPFHAPESLATGTELKNTFTVARDRYAFISHHIGDLENFETLQSFEEGIRHFEKLFKVQPHIIACDLHPDYLATRYAVQRADRENLPLLKIQHHHAHLAACLCDNGWENDDKKAIGIIFDGTGLGTDGSIWGGEILFGNYAGFERKFHLEPIPLPGGDAAIRNPSRTALAYLWNSGLNWSSNLAPVAAFSEAERALFLHQLKNQINTPITTSMGRLFDAVSALLGICAVTSYEGQAAIELENLVDSQEDAIYPFILDGKIIRFSSIIESIVLDYQKGIPTERISARFHNGIIAMIKEICVNIKQETGCLDVALSGGVWQNMVLLEGTIKELSAMGFNVLWHHKLPANDGGVSLGQLAIAAAYIQNTGQEEICV